MQCPIISEKAQVQYRPGVTSLSRVKVVSSYILEDEETFQIFSIETSTRNQDKKKKKKNERQKQKNVLDHVPKDSKAPGRKAD